MLQRGVVASNTQGRESPEHIQSSDHSGEVLNSRFSCVGSIRYMFNTGLVLMTNVELPATRLVSVLNMLIHGPLLYRRPQDYLGIATIKTGSEHFPLICESR